MALRLVPHELRLAGRLLARTPGFTAIALLCIGLGVGANIAAFSVLSAVLLRPLPFVDADGLAVLLDTHAGAGSDPESFVVSPPNYAAWVAHNTVFSELAAAQPRGFALSSGGEPERIDGTEVSASFFHVLGAPPLLGRGFTTEEDTPPGVASVILSEELWRSRFGADPSILRRKLQLDGRSYAIVGVMPARFRFPDQSRLWTPLALDPGKSPQRLFHLLYVYGRLRPGVSTTQAQKAMSALAMRLAAEFPDTNQGWGVRVQPIRDYIVGDVRPALAILQVAVGMVLLIACVNVANLIIARIEGRRSELSVRVALGESRARRLRRQLAEATLLSVSGGALGLLVASLGVHALLPFIPPAILPLPNVTLDARVLGFSDRKSTR